MKNLIIIFLLLPFFLFSQTKSDSTQISLRDSLSVLTKRIDRLESLLNKKNNNPADNFKNKIIGFEINPGFLLFGNVSGGIQLFFVDPTGEISIPFYFYNKNNRQRSYEFFFLGEENSVFDIDVQYRKFSNNIRNGSWAGFGFKYTHLDGIKDYDFDDSNFKHEDYYGIVFGVGYRAYGTNGFYYGISVMTGRYFSFGEKDTMTDKLIFNVEFLKLGYAF